jgi:NADH-ubiquinone oxidoreductase chain 6
LHDKFDRRVFLVISAYLLLTGMSFIGLSYILVYISAISILFLFTLMLINIRISELHSDNYNSLFLGIIISAIIYSSIILNLNFTIKDSSWYKSIFYSNHDKWDSNMGALNEMTAIGNILYTSHAMLLLITSIILLLAMIGAIIVTLGHKTASFLLFTYPRLSEKKKKQQ